MKKFAGALILLIVGALLSCPKPTGSTSPSKVWVVSTLAGSSRGFDDRVGAAAKFRLPYAVAVDSSGNVYVADTYNHRIRKISTEKVVSTIAGGSTSGFADGAGTSARFYYPTDVAVDAEGNVYVADQLSHRIRKITPDGVVSTIAGGSTSGFADGAGTSARFNNPSGLALDSSGNVYVADQYNHRIRKIAPAVGESDREVSTIAGGSTRGSDDGAGRSARFNNPTGLALDSSGNIYVADYGNHLIRKISTEKVVSTIAGGSTSGSADGAGRSARFTSPYGLALDAEGNLYVADSSNHLIRKITPGGLVSTIAGGGSTASGKENGPGRSARFNSPYGLALDAEGNLYVADRDNHRIRKMEYKLP